MAGAAYASLNLRWNPFGALTRVEKQALTVPRFDLAPFIRRLQQPGYALQILPHGAPGKTTHLLFIRDHFPGAPYLCCDAREQAPAIPAAAVYFLDQLQEMPLKERVALFRRPASFALVSHHNHRLEFRLAGLSYDLISLPSYDAARMKIAIDRRLAWARRDGARPLPAISLETCQRLLQRYQNEVAVFVYLYDVVERLAADVTPADERRYWINERRPVALR